MCIRDSCTAFAPVFDKVKQELESPEIEFENINVDEDVTGIAAQYGVRSIPYMILLQDGQKVKEQVGVLPEEVLKNFILN